MRFFTVVVLHEGRRYGSTQEGRTPEDAMWAHYVTHPETPRGNYWPLVLWVAVTYGAVLVPLPQWASIAAGFLWIGFTVHTFAEKGGK